MRQEIRGRVDVLARRVRGPDGAGWEVSRCVRMVEWHKIGRSAGREGRVAENLVQPGAERGDAPWKNERYVVAVKADGPGRCACVFTILRMEDHLNQGKCQTSSGTVAS